MLHGGVGEAVKTSAAASEAEPQMSGSQVSDAASLAERMWCIARC
jgi:hypothetical protein